jgi:DNA-binding NarL/FixJ family response regulator
MVATGYGGLGDAATRRPRIEGRLRTVRERGALSVLVPALALSSYARAAAGDHAGAFADAGEAVALASQLQFVADAAPAHEMLAWQCAARGLHEQAQQELDRAAVLVQRAGTTDAAAHLALTAAFCALCRTDLDEVVRLLDARIDADGGRGAMGEPLGVAPLLVEAYAGLRRRDEAAGLTARYAQVAPRLPSAAGLVARCRALAAADDDEAIHAFAEALTLHARAHEPFEAARTRLLCGSRLRRAGRRIDARGHLAAARDAFASWDLAHWVGVAESELRATGATPRRRGPLATEPLTSQESRVATLVAQGLSNREVAAALFLSPKTVEHHLSRVYRKRGWRSRTELTRALANADDTHRSRTQHPG